MSAQHTADHPSATAVGDVAITRVEEMHGPIMPPSDFFPTIPAAAWAEHADELAPDHLESDLSMIKVAMQTWVLRSQGRLIVVDTGVGNGKSRPAVDAWDHLDLDYVQRLRDAGVDPADVDLVVNTHLHVDHVGWNTTLRDGEWALTFPNATYLLPKADVEYWDPAKNSNIAGGVNENVFEDSIQPVLDSGRYEVWEGSHAIDDDLTLLPAPGHTPGTSILQIASAGEHGLLAGDLVHTPLQVGEIGHSSCFCEDPAAAARTRTAYFGWASENNALILPAHFCGHTGFRVAREDGRFRISEWADLGRL